MTVTQQRPAARPERFRDELIRPFLVFVAVAGTIAQWPVTHIVFPPVALPVFILAALAAIAALFPWTRLTARQQLALITADMLFGALLLPFAHLTTTGAVFPYIAASTAGMKLASRKAAIAVAVSGAIVSVGATALIDQLAPSASQWPWWVPLTVAFPVYMGMSQRDRLDALYNAQVAAEEAQRATASEAREAALLERGRIAREIHDVLGHSLSGIALQLDLADALREEGRADDSAVAVRRARALAVDSISETRRAVHALREDTLPLPDTLRRLAEHNDAELDITGDVTEVGAETTHTMVRAAQEALTNAAKHAPGADRTMRLACTADHVTLTVHNGPATETPSADLADGTGVGLIGMRERAALLGGTLRAEPTRDGGWTVELELPR
jgi:signal transduction histidine kinase